MQVDGFSLAAQKADITKYAEAIGIQIVGEFCDEGKSGKSDKRPEFMFGMCWFSNSPVLPEMPPTLSRICN